MIEFYTATLGCKINQYETRAIAEAWAGKAGSQAMETLDPLAADLILINSCAVTANAVRDLRRSVRKYHRDNPAAGIIITGCAAQIMPEELAQLPGVVRVIPQEEKSGLLEGPDSSGRKPATPFAPFSIAGYHRSRPVVKVQDGCSHFCTFCIVPLARGRSVSRPVDEIAAEVGRLLDAGFREMILSGVNLRQFGRDLDGKPSFWDVVHRLEQEFAPRWAGRARFRISSLEPGQLDARALEVLGGSKLVCPQLHISLQSGSPSVLKRMGRGHYKPQQALDFCRELRAFWPEFGLGADLLVGFPGETDEEFETTMEFCAELPLTYGHVFPYSPRPGTKAADMDGQLPPEVKKERAARLRKLVSGKKKAFLKKLLAMDELAVLVQDETGKGVSEYYAACQVEPAGPIAPKSLVRCRPVGMAGRDVVRCEPVE
ncbi:tRNA (N(6)-L-threonylcarbamoyladenosine(37)-C(2))-methylthiotransferase MtaB [Salidesulfovibrio onnuriiensis]|uniref:tRNA (N(6)-L-threonylcarbamoyladenosine(37)-C(2))- methylthiotransferase MtaB n=1 Tax=Salidesulfovibrio onnuriiensis TaxID=2583823 RepID=UPI0011C98D0D|nr:tRNA (N(6)-L-threonylcarbamoyladenosine(37)-C(2))-methylthiotransferase MtaB [Salidesulfovibrio onnuriiensis]